MFESRYDARRARDRAAAFFAAFDGAAAQPGTDEAEPIREAKRIVQARAPALAQLLTVVTADAMAGKKLPPGVWKAAELARWQLEIAGLKRGFEIDTGPSESFRQWMGEWYAQRNGDVAAPPALSDGETVEAVLLKAGELAEPTADIEGEEERDDDGDDWSEDEHGHGSEPRTAEQHQPGANRPRPSA